ncbi:M57 family metalloprotease [Niabella pedocola]|uniref:M57 family metalloprotease n=1 Tax=Niabella pedocola TaxID=1752077 RepID=A0ABS8PYN4_9BACT|nr:M57 family metalloprotease [Niabella pedocola]MCD2426195.1 M57 family metalloprotease [Niabella pedocola]
MRRLHAITAIVTTSVMLYTSCKKSNFDQQASDFGLVAKEKQGVVKGVGITPDNYLPAFKKEGAKVDGDIVSFDIPSEGPKQVVALRPYLTPGIENYYQPVNSGYQRNITIGMSASTWTWNNVSAADIQKCSEALDSAIAYYNTYVNRSNIKFVRQPPIIVNPAPNIVVYLDNYNKGWGGLGIFPFDGKPGYAIYLEMNGIGNRTKGWMSTLIAHEMGHNIGVEHTNIFYNNGTGAPAGQVQYTYPGTSVTYRYDLWLLQNVSGAPGFPDWTNMFNPDPSSLWNSSISRDWTQSIDEYGNYSGYGFSGYDREALEYVYPYIPQVSQVTVADDPVYSLTWLPDNVLVSWDIIKMVNGVETSWGSQNPLSCPNIIDLSGDFKTVKIGRGTLQYSPESVRLRARIYKNGEEISNRYEAYPTSVDFTLPARMP